MPQIRNFGVSLGSNSKAKRSPDWIVKLKKTICSIARNSAIALSRSWHLSLNATKINFVIKWQLSQPGDLTNDPDRRNMLSKNRLRILWIYMSNSDATNLETRLGRHHWFPRQRRLRNERGNSILVTSLPRPGWCFWLVLSRGKFVSTNQKHYPVLVSDTSSVFFSFIFYLNIHYYIYTNNVLLQAHKIHFLLYIK